MHVLLYACILSRMHGCISTNRKPVKSQNNERIPGRVNLKANPRKTPLFPLPFPSHSPRPLHWATLAPLQETGVCNRSAEDKEQVTQQVRDEVAPRPAPPHGDNLLCDKRQQVGSACAHPLPVPSCLLTAISCKATAALASPGSTGWHLLVPPLSSSCP